MFIKLCSCCLRPSLILLLMLPSAGDSSEPPKSQLFLCAYTASVESKKTYF